MRVSLLFLAVSLVVFAVHVGGVAVPHKVYTIEEIEEEIKDPELRDIFHSASEKLKGLNVKTDLKEIERSFHSMVTALRKRIAVSFRSVRTKLFLDPPAKNATETKGPVGGNSSDLLERGPPEIVDHLGTMDALFRVWIPEIKKDIEMASLIMNKLASDLGSQAVVLAQQASEQLRRIPVKYGRLRRKLQMAFSRKDHKSHAELHKERVIQSDCGKKYTVEEFVEIFDHDHNLRLTEESFWTPEFRDEFYSGWPVWANEMRLVDPACGSKKWFIPPSSNEKEL